MFITALSIASLLLAQGTHVAGPPTGYVLENLQIAQRIMSADDSAIALQGSGVLGADGEIAVSLRLDPGGDYQVVGVCDGCSDVDMWAQDRGELLGGDLEPRRLVMFPLVAPASGAITFTISMPDCDIGRCAYAYRIYSAASGW